MIDPKPVDVGDSLSANAYEAADWADASREEIMNDIRDAIESNANGTNDVDGVEVEIDGIAVDISSGAGALLLDDKLQELSTIEQSAAQILAANNRAQKEVNQLLR